MWHLKHAALTSEHFIRGRGENNLIFQELLWKKIWYNFYIKITAPLCSIMRVRKQLFDTSAKMIEALQTFTWKRGSSVPTHDLCRVMKRRRHFCDAARLSWALRKNSLQIDEEVSSWHYNIQSSHILSRHLFLSADVFRYRLTKCWNIRLMLRLHFAQSIDANGVQFSHISLLKCTAMKSLMHGHKNPGIYSHLMYVTNGLILDPSTQRGLYLLDQITTETWSPSWDLVGYLFLCTVMNTVASWKYL